ncbi:MAG: alpha/beta fold hydrolase [Vulcanimicrobiaceae bacterium]|nr:alpha/beta hydrolase [Bacillota bacterium]
MKPALVFLHGSGFTGYAFRAQVDAFSGSHAPNLPGHCVPGSCASVAEFATFVEAYVREWQLPRVVLAGSSLGGAIALECALRGIPGLAGIVLLGSGARLRVAPAFLDGLRDDFEATARTIAGYLYAEATPERVEDAVASMKLVGQAQTLLDFIACNAFDAVDRLAGLRLPLLAITGALDRMTPPKFAQMFADRVEGGQARIVPEAGHLVMIERPELTNELIRDFVHAL